MSLHSFDPAIAKKAGINAAVIYQNLLFWCEKNKANQRHIYNGKHWTYNSISAFCDLMPYLSSKQIRTALDKLESLNLIESGCFNKSGYDRTKWYTCNCLNGKNQLPPEANGNALEGEPIPDSKPNGKPDNKQVDLLGDKPPKNPACPHSQIINLWHEVLPQCKKVRVWGDDRQRLLSARWKELLKRGRITDKESGLKYFEELFCFIGASNSFLVDSKWFGLDWLINAKNFAKVIEGSYIDNDNKN